MKRRVQFVSIVLCCLLLSLGPASGAGGVGSTEATVRTAMLGPAADLAPLPSILRAHSPDPPNSVDHRAGEGYFAVPDVVGQFNNLQPHGDPMAFRLGAGDDPTLYRHYQGMARIDDSDGTPYIILTRSAHYAGDYPGELLVVEMGSRVNRGGERLRSNLLQHDVWMGDTVAPPEDKGVSHIHFNGQDGWPAYSHAGGGQLISDVLAVPLEFYCPTVYQGGTGNCATSPLDNQGGIALINVSTPITPQLIYYEDFYQTEGDTWGKKTGLGVVGVTYVPQGQHPSTARGARYLFIMTWGEGHQVRFAWSNSDDLKQTTDLVPETFTWSDDDFESPATWRNWQMLNFVRDTNGTLYLIAADKTTYLGSDEHWLGLFKVDVGKLTASDYQQAISFVAQKKLKLNEPPMGSLDAASGIYVSPSRQLILYTGPHDNDGPKDEGGIGTVDMGEFRNIDVYHEGTTARKTMCPWVELYQDVDGWLYQDRSLMLDFQDRSLEDWQDLRKENFNDEASSLRTYLAPGQLFRLYEDVNYGGSDWPKVGDGTVWASPGLGADGFNDKTSSVKLFPFADPGGPYNGNEGNSIPLDAANRCYLDGEATFTWSVDSSACTLSNPAARQPTLTCGDNGHFTVSLMVIEGPDSSSTISTTVTVTNVAPIVTARGSAIDENGWATVSGTITDPGTEDTFTVIINWGDGSDTYNYPAGTTTYSEQHQYLDYNSTVTPSQAYRVTVVVLDDDGGLGIATTIVNAIPVFLPLVLKG